MSSFTSATLGAVHRPVNILKEFLELFSRGNKCKAVILSWLDGKLFSGSEWVRVTFQDLADTLGYCRETIAKHIKELVELKILEETVKGKKPFPTDTAKKYRLNVEKLLELTMRKTSHLGEEDFASYYILKNSSKQQQDAAVNEEFPEPDWDAVKAKVEEEQSQLIAQMDDLTQTESAQPQDQGLDQSSAAPPSPVENDAAQKVTDAGIKLNPQLRSLLTQFTLEEVQSALSLYRATKQRKTIQNPPGWLTDCLRGKWWVSDSSSSVPIGFNEWYKRAKRKGLVQAAMLVDGVQCVVLADGNYLSYEEAKKEFGSG